MKILNSGATGTINSGTFIYMKYIVPALLIMLFTAGNTIGQTVKKLTGTWYGKFRSYQFIQNGTANCYSATPVANCLEKLMIGNNGKYVFVSYHNKDSVKTEGDFSLREDTLIFTPVSVNNKQAINAKPQHFILYYADTAALVYSVFPVQQETATAPSLFSKVETGAMYSKGNDAFLKCLYEKVYSSGPPENDTVSLNRYRVVINAYGKIDVSTLESVSASPQFFAAVKEGLQCLQYDFIPATQNGKVVKAYFNFTISL